MAGRRAWPRGRGSLLTLVLLVVAPLGACGGDEGVGAAPTRTAAAPSEDEAPEPSEDEAPEQRYPDVENVLLDPAGPPRTYDLSVTVSSPYDSPERYADGWRVVAPDGTVLGEHTLRHDHAAEQPFTRTQTGLRIPRGVSRVVVEARDSEHGYGGATVTVLVDQPDS
jgi:hypothetical protein